ncbi:hypothetical protein GWR56_14115 [Mucilaginibacter sp. 14171R-50]|uniref:hypothetical protein n=1 Tax=Mucilaginibacter sp. 14171R-50 TaxID=2703789 RepID=UPI00138C3C92|nr:hypothetical protein [Mucilaginibacter sp. 14171R-50]QHS56624.1 hypothetical protein GWR56_14115 [Mucilaginibacter sp. 14171R-50]
MLFQTPKRKARRVQVERRKSEPTIQNGFGIEMPPQRLLVEIYFDQKECPNQASVFYEHYQKADWASPKGTPYRNWKLLAGDWIYNYQQAVKLAKRIRTNALSKLSL